ncbi:MAG TPA: hypothetical protein VD931_08595 [Baekduia sp.]|nr:hypothetical protein [Baekduia sp.]
MRTIWIVLAAYAVLYALTAILTGDGAVVVAGLLVGLVILLPATVLTLRAQRTPAGRRPLGERR